MNPLHWSADCGPGRLRSRPNIGPSPSRDRSGAPLTPANILTACNLACGVASLLQPEEAPPRRRAALILLGAMFDALDGSLARRLGCATELGAAADSAADFVSGGIAPAILLAHNGPARQTRWSRLAPGVYIAAAASRSARRGMKPRISHVFSGVPPIGAGVILAAGFQMRLPPRMLTHLAIALSLAMASNIRVLSAEAILRRDLPLDIPSSES